MVPDGGVVAAGGRSLIYPPWQMELDRISLEPDVVIFADSSKVELCGSNGKRRTHHGAFELGGLTGIWAQCNGTYFCSGLRGQKPYYVLGGWEEPYLRTSSDGGPSSSASSSSSSAGRRTQTDFVPLVSFIVFSEDRWVVGYKNKYGHVVQLLQSLSGAEAVDDVKSWHWARWVRARERSAVTAVPVSVKVLFPAHKQVLSCASPVLHAALCCSETEEKPEQFSLGEEFTPSQILSLLFHVYPGSYTIDVFEIPKILPVFFKFDVRSGLNLLFEWISKNPSLEAVKAWERIIPEHARRQAPWPQAVIQKITSELFVLLHSREAVHLKTCEQLSHDTMKRMMRY